MTNDETIARIAAYVDEGRPVHVFDARILLRRIDELKAYNEMAAEHMARGREYSARLEAELDRLKLAVMEHRDQKADDRCWMDDDKLTDRRR